MKKRIVIVFMLFISSYVDLESFAKPSFDFYSQKSETRFLMPEFVDLKLFKRELVHKAPLKSIFDQLKRDTLVGYFMYTFTVSKEGKVIPNLYYDNYNPSFKAVNVFIIKVFNKYKWHPGYKKKCQKCKVAIPLQMALYFNTKDSSISILIKEVAAFYTKPFIQFSFNYKDLPPVSPDVPSRTKLRDDL